MEGSREVIVTEEESFAILLLRPMVQLAELEEAVADSKSAKEGLCLVEMWADC